MPIRSGVKLEVPVVYRLAADGGARIDQARAVRVGEADRVRLVDVAKAGRARSAAQRRSRVRRVVRAHEIDGRAVRGSAEPAHQRRRPADAARDGPRARAPRRRPRSGVDIEVPWSQPKASPLRREARRVEGDDWIGSLQIRPFLASAPNEPQRAGQDVAGARRRRRGSRRRGRRRERRGRPASRSSSSRRAGRARRRASASAAAPRPARRRSRSRSPRPSSRRGRRRERRARHAGRTRRASRCPEPSVAIPSAAGRDLADALEAPSVERHRHAVDAHVLVAGGREHGHAVPSGSSRPRR